MREFLFAPFRENYLQKELALLDALYRRQIDAFDGLLAVTADRIHVVS